MRSKAAKIDPKAKAKYIRQGYIFKTGIKIQ